MSNWKVLKKVMASIGKYRWLLVVSVVLAAVTVVLTLYAPILFGNAIDYILGPGHVDFDSIAVILGKVLGILILCSALTWVMNLVNNKLTYETVRDIRAKGIRALQHQPLSYLDAHSIGDITDRMIADVDQVSDGLLLGFTQLFTGVLTIIVTLIFMFQHSVSISILVVVLTPLSFLVARFITAHSYTMFRKQNETRGRQTALIDEMIGNARTVKSLGRGERAEERFNALNEELRQNSLRAVYYSSLTNPATRAVNSIIYACVALFGTKMILQGKLTVGGLTIMLSYANQYSKPFNDIAAVVTELQNALSCAARVFDWMETEPESADADGVLADIKGNVVLDHVKFSYSEDNPLIEDLNLNVKPGMSVAIAGPTGCGKTTLINLLMRFYDVKGGSISVDDHDIRSVTRASLRQQYGMVLQDSWLIHGTVRQNIVFGKPDATDAEIIEAAKLANSWEFIQKLPNGLDTVLTEDSLSQGQKQLLCITRVMLVQPPMLILDEATSSIDTRTEIAIGKAFDTLMAKRTSFVVAHRLSTIRNADVILVMKHGHIVEMGTHDELLAKRGFYFDLYQSQFAGKQI